MLFRNCIIQFIIGVPFTLWILSLLLTHQKNNISCWYITLANDKPNYGIY